MTRSFQHLIWLIPVVLLVFMGSLLLPADSVAAPAIIPQERRVDWNPGMTGGIPAVAVTHRVTDFGARGDGVTDDAAAFQAAMDAAHAAGGGAVSIPAGTYLLRAPLFLQSGVVLRGEGGDSSHLVFDLGGAYAHGLIQATGYYRDNWPFVSITGGYEKGSTAITVADPSYFSVGMVVEIQQNNDPVWAALYPAYWQGVTWAEGSVGELVEIAAIQGNRLTLTEPLHHPYSGNFQPGVRRVGVVSDIGIENLHLRRRDAGGGDMILYFYTVNAWVRGVVSENILNSHVLAHTSRDCEIRDSYFHHAQGYGGGGQGYGVELGLHTTDCLVENNIFQSLRHAMMVQLGASGNVFGYNYSRETVGQPDISVHGHYASYNLFEGNVVEYGYASDHWGPAGPGNTFLRNCFQTYSLYFEEHSHGQNAVGNEFLNPGSGVLADSTVQDTLIHGNYQQGAIQWDPSIPDHTIPTSYYLSGPPTFFQGAPWPATGADMGAQLGSCNIPAYQRWQTGNYLPQTVPLVSQLTVTTARAAQLDGIPLTGVGETVRVAMDYTGSDLDRLFVIIGRNSVMSDRRFTARYLVDTDQIQLFGPNQAWENCSGGSLSSNYVVLDCDATTVTSIPGGYRLTWVFTPLQPLDDFTGPVPIYGMARIGSGDSSGWYDLGLVRILPQAPLAENVAVMPVPGDLNTDASVTVRYLHGSGSTALARVGIAINSNNTLTKGMYVRYFTDTNQLKLRDDTNSAWVDSCSPGQNKTLETLWVRIICRDLAVVEDAYTLDLTVGFQPKRIFSGRARSMPVRLHAIDQWENVFPWDQLASWSMVKHAPTTEWLVATPDPAPYGTRVTLSTRYGDIDGEPNLFTALLVINNRLTLAQGYARYIATRDELALRNRDNTGWVGSCQPGQAGILDNGLYKIDCASTNVRRANRDITIDWAILYDGDVPREAQPRHIYLRARDRDRVQSPWQDAIVWNLQSAGGFSQPQLANSPLQLPLAEEMALQAEENIELEEEDIQFMIPNDFVPQPGDPSWPLYLPLWRR